MRNRYFLIVCFAVAMTGCASEEGRSRVSNLGFGFRTEVTEVHGSFTGHETVTERLIYEDANIKNREIWPAVGYITTAPGWIFFIGFGDAGEKYFLGHSVKNSKNVVFGAIALAYLAGVTGYDVAKCGKFGPTVRYEDQALVFSSTVLTDRVTKFFELKTVVPYAELAHLDAWLATADLPVAYTTRDGFTAYAATGYTPAHWTVTATMSECLPRPGGGGSQWHERIPVGLPLPK